MLKMKSVSSPTLAAGAFDVVFGDAAIIINDPEAGASKLTTDTGAAPTTFPMTNTTGFRVGQTVLVKDTAGHAETGVVSVVTPGVSIQTAAPLVATYTVANQSTVTVVSPHVLVELTNPFTDMLTFAASWAVSGTTVTITIEKASIDAGPDIQWAPAVTADLAGVIVSVIADCE